MGMESTCKVTYHGKSAEAKALLEGDHVLIRATDFRLKLPFAGLRKVEAKAGILLLDSPEADGPVKLALGDPAAAKWEKKILHPPTRADKLGIKPGVGIFHEGEFERKFYGELSGQEQPPHLAGLLFFAAETRPDLKRAAELAKLMQPTSALWIVYPKANPDIGENDVITTMRNAGFSDAKVCGFSATHTALKFIVPVARRPKPVK